MAEIIMDRTTWAILRELQLDARISYSELGRRVHLTSPAVAERVRRLEEGDVIRGYRAVLNPQRLGLPIEAIVRLASASPAACREFSRSASELPEVAECIRVTGSDSYVLRVLAVSVEHLEAVLSTLSRYGQGVTSIVLSRPVPNRVIECPAGWFDQSGAGADGPSPSVNHVVLRTPHPR